MIVKQTDVFFENSFKGKMVTPNGEVAIGLEDGTIEPYDMLIGALASCLYATFLDVVEKKKGRFETAEFHVEWEKRKEVPTILKWVNIKLTIIGSEEKDRLGIEKAAKLATKYCSIYQTISRVAEMSLEVLYE